MISLYRRKNCSRFYAMDQYFFFHFKKNMWSYMVIYGPIVVIYGHIWSNLGKTFAFHIHSSGTWYIRVALRVPNKTRKYQESLKTSYNYSKVPSLAPKTNILLILAKNSWKKEIWPFPVVGYFTWKLELVSIKYFVHDWLCKLFSAPYSPQATSNLIF